MFERQADSFLHPEHTDDYLISPVDDYDEYDSADDPVDSGSTDAQGSGRMSHQTPKTLLDGSGMESVQPEDLPILLPSSLGWEWCVSHGTQHLAIKEAQLRQAQADHSIHRIRLALGFKSALFHTQVRPANTQQTKTRAWNAVHSVDTTVQEHARVYSMARDAYRSIRQSLTEQQDLPKLHLADLHVATIVLGAEQTGQRNKQKSWIWGFGQTVERDGTWTGDCELLNLIDATL